MLKFDGMDGMSYSVYSVLAAVLVLFQIVDTIPTKKGYSVQQEVSKNNFITFSKKHLDLI